MDFKQFKLQRLDSISPSFCAAKWLHSSFYLHTATTSSCYYPAPEQIDLARAEQNINEFNNIPAKISQRKDMLTGQRPAACVNCWMQEDADPAALSDRIVESY